MALGDGAYGAPGRGDTPVCPVTAAFLWAETLRVLHLAWSLPRLHHMQYLQPLTSFCQRHEAWY